MLFHRGALLLSHQTLTFVSGLVRAHRKQLGSVWRKLDPGQQALLVLVYLRKGEPFADVGAGFAVSTTTCWRYVNETVELLAQRSPKLRNALRKAKRQGIAAARIWNILAALRDAGLIALGDKGYHGYDQTGRHVVTPYKGRNKPESQKTANRAHARLRGPGERANAQLKTWRILRKLRCCPRSAGRLAKAIHVLRNHEVTAG